MSHFEQYQEMYLNENLSAAEALKMHSKKVLGLAQEISKHSGNPEKVRELLRDLGRQHYDQGILEEHLDMLGPIVCHTIRPIVFKSGLWSIEVEKSWNHLFDVITNMMRTGQSVISFS